MSLRTHRCPQKDRANAKSDTKDQERAIRFIRWGMVGSSCDMVVETNLGIRPDVDRRPGRLWMPQNITNHLCRDSNIRTYVCLAAPLRHIGGTTIAGHSVAAVPLRLRERLVWHKACKLGDKDPTQQDAQNQRSRRPRHVESITSARHGCDRYRSSLGT